MFQAPDVGAAVPEASRDPGWPLRSEYNPAISLDARLWLLTNTLSDVALPVTQTGESECLGGSCRGVTYT